MKVEKLEEKVDIPEGVEVNIDKDTLNVKGAKGELSRKLANPRVNISKAGNEVVLSSENATKREKKIVLTFKAHVKNMLKGATEGCTYRLKICSGHFPMNVSVSGDKFSVKNFLVRD